MSDLWQAQQEFVKSLPRAGPAIILILLISGRSLTGREMETATGYSDKLIKSALGWLEPRGVVQNNGQRHGWSLGRGLGQLPISPELLGEWVFLLGGQKLGDVGDARPLAIPGNMTHPEIGISDLSTSEIGISDLRPLGGGLNINILNQGSNQPPPTNGAASSEFPNSEENLVFWLVRGGISPKSPKGKAILRLGLSIDEVRSTVLQVEYEKREWQRMSLYDRHRLGREHEPGAGRTIYRLESGAVLWPRRCASCLEELVLCRCEEGEGEVVDADNDAGNEMTAVSEAVAAMVGTNEAERALDLPFGNGRISPATAWRATLSELELQMTKATFNTWLKGARLTAVEGGCFVIGVRNDYAREWLENRLGDTVLRTLSAILGSEVSARFEVSA